MDESLLISKAEKYLNKIQNEEINLENISDLDTFKSIYSIFLNRIEDLQDFKKDMDAKGYTAPYRSLTRYGSNTGGDVSFEEISEVNKYGQYFRMKATAKKNIIDRVKSSIDAHKIAIGHLDEYGIFKCKSCSKSFRPNIFAESLEKCSCDSKDFTFEVNKKGVHRLDIIPYLPLSGNYMVMMSELTKWGRESFKKILNLLKQERRGLVKTVSVIIKFKENDRWIRKRITLDSEFVNSYEEEIRKEYGKNVRIEFLQFNRIKPTVINDKHTRTALAIGYARYSENFLKKNKSSIFKDKIKDISKLKIYDKILNELRTETLKFSDEEDLDIWKEYETKNRLKEKKLMDTKGKLDSTLFQDIETRKAIENKLFSEIAPTLILWDIFKFYLTTSQDRRKRYGGPFPFLRGDIDRKQREIFKKENINAVEILKKYKNEKIIKITNMDFLLNKKFNLETKIKGSNIKPDYVGLGAAIISLNSDISLLELSKTFNVDENTINNEIKNIKSIEKPKSKKSKKFLDMIKK